MPAAASPPRSTARGFINITATARKADNPDRNSATGAPATVFRTFPVSDAVRRKDDNGAVSKPAALPDEASPRRSSASGAPASQDNALLVRVTAAVTEGNVLIPSTENPRRITASGPSTAASATAKVPRPTAQRPRDAFYRVQNIHQRLAQRFAQAAEGVLRSGFDQQPLSGK